MDCAKSLAMLSEFRDGIISEEERALVKAHLANCTPCDGVFRDLDVIVMAASGLRAEQGFTFPDENALWRRMAIAKRAVH
ncbi:MAG TPA: zf-HC2 domain-containing protein [Pyrinomonadaceae bacterium]|jgi:predicted anti-sigma-YlaC factor YlaD